MELSKLCALGAKMCVDGKIPNYPPTVCYDLDHLSDDFAAPDMVEVPDSSPDVPVEEVADVPEAG
jgi:hypothetical protein